MPFRRVPELAEAAAAELAAREKYYPAMVETGTLDRDAAALDLASWRAIAVMLDAGSAQTDLRWRDLALATSRALVSVQSKLARKPGDAALAARLEAVQWIHDRFAWHAWFMTGMRGPHPGPPPRAPLQAAA